jgi:hypothetical protein
MGWGAGMQTQQVVFFKGDSGTKLKTPGARKNESRRALQTPTWRGFAISNTSQYEVYA